MIKKFLKNMSLTFLSLLVLLSLASVLVGHSNRFKSLIVFGDSGLIIRASSKIVNNGTSTFGKAMTIGTDGSGVDFTLYTDTASEEVLWDASLNKLTIDGTNAANAFEITDGNSAFTDDVDVDGVTNLDVTDIDGAVDMATTLLVTGVSTLTGGLVFPTMSTVIWSAGGAVALATSGTDQAPTSGPRQWVEVQVPYNVTLTGIGYLVGSVGGTDSVVVELFNSAGTVVARSIASDTEIADIVGATVEFDKIAFSSTYAAVAGTYYISVQLNGTTARLRTFPIPNSPFVANTAAGTFKTGASITPTTTFVAGEGPISFLY